jgi:RNA polymerase sigma-70 factor (ECF subfamily)
LEERLLIASCQRGDPSAFAQLYRSYRPYVFTVAYRITLCEEAARDVVQEVFARVAAGLPELNGAGSFKAWIGTVAARVAIDWQRASARREEATDPNDFERKASGLGDPRQIYLNREHHRRIEDAMRHLSPQQRAILYLRLSEDLRPKEIARRLQLPDRQVRSQTHRAIARLRDLLKGDLE